MQAAARGARQLVLEAHARGELEGVFGLGGSAGTAIGTESMRALPLGVPKVMVSTLASGQTRSFVGDRDITLVNSVVDVLGINRISRRILTNAAHALAGMVQAGPVRDARSDRPLVAATMFGVTTKCVERAKVLLEAEGCEVLVFHATGSGGQAMESLIRDGLISGVLDVTTTELADELVGGFLSAGPLRLTAAAHCGVPQVVSVGALDMVNFFGLESVPQAFRERRLHKHNDHVTLMRTTADENALLGAEIASKLSNARGPTKVLFPLRGVSALDRDGQPFDDPAARKALLEGLLGARPGVETSVLDLHINDPQFAETAARDLLALMRLQTSA